MHTGQERQGRLGTMAETPSLFKGTMPIDLFHMVAGDRIGQGIAREVYVFKLDDEKVIKFELGTYDFQNVMEWTTWTEAPQAARRWLAPCIDISPNGKILIQQRVTPWLGPIPAKHPKWLDDIHKANWGTFEGRPVMVDYGRSDLIRRGFR